MPTRIGSTVEARSSILVLLLLMPSLAIGFTVHPLHPRLPGITGRRSRNTWGKGGETTSTPRRMNDGAGADAGGGGGGGGALPADVFEAILEQGYGSREDLSRMCDKLATPASIGIRTNLLSATRSQVEADVRKLCSDMYGPEYAAGVCSHPLVPESILVPPRLTTHEAEIHDMASKLPHVVTGRMCGEAVLQGAEVYAPGVGSAPAKMTAGDLVAVYSDVTDTLSRGGISSEVDDLGSSRVKLLGIGRAVMSRKEVFGTKKSSGVAISMEERVWQAPPLSDFVSQSGGTCALQALPAMTVARVLAPVRGDRILDMCAAPGGKAAHVSELMGGQGQVIACDRGERKVQGMRVLAQQHGIAQIMIPTKADATCCINDGTFERGSFDRVLLDPPCSALGLRPSLRPNDGSTPEGLQRNVNYQRSMFRQAVQALKPGGTLVYSTCTINPSENEGIVAWALRGFECLELCGHEELRVGGVGIACCGLEEREASMVQRFTPGDGEVGDAFTGFFIAKFRKRDVD